MTDELDIKLRAILIEKGKESFVKDYDPSDEEILGLIVSHVLKWDGLRIAKAAYNAFEDANFHTLNEAFVKLLKKHGLDVTEDWK